MKTDILILSLSALLPACFLSSWPETECEIPAVCGAGYSEVGVCTDRECFLASACGRSIYCQRDTCDEIGCAPGEAEVPRCEASADCVVRATECGSVYCQSNLCNAFPSCDEGEEEVATCAGQDESCHSVSECGTTIYCAPPCVIPRVCDEVSQIQYDDECPPGEYCEEHRACGQVVYCAEVPVCESVAPCTGSPSPVVQSGEGLCPPVLPGPEPRDTCYVENSCGFLTYCITACDLSHYVVNDPSECLAGGACYPASGEGVEVWCTGEDLNCDAEPFCEEEEIQMTVGEVCPSDWRCRIVEACGAAIQCGQPPRPDGDEPRSR